MEEPISRKIIWNSSSDDPQGGSMEVVFSMDDFVGSNYDYVSILYKELHEEKEKYKVTKWERISSRETKSVNRTT